MNLETFTILIVDDDVTQLSVLRNLLSGYHNCKILQATDGAAALQIVQKYLPDIVISDWQMPKLSGLELLNYIKQNPKTQTIEVLLITGHKTLPNNLKQALELGAADYLNKPLEEVEFMARFQAALKRRRYLNLLTQQQEALQDEKNRKLSSIALQMQEQSVLLSYIDERLEKIISDYPNKNLRQDIREIRKRIDQNNRNTKDWERFKLHFEQVHPLFFQKLLKINAGLSAQDLRHCAYLRMRINNKEIASLLYVSPDSLKVIRSRLKKKLKLGNKHNLNDFINNL